MTSNLVEFTDAVGDVELGQNVGNVELAETERITSVIVPIFFSKLSEVLLLWVVAIGSPMETLSRFWSDNYFRLVFEKEDETKSTLGFMIKALLVFAAIKSQEQIGFPFKTHPQAIMVSINSLLIYGFASALQHVFSAQESVCRGFRNTIITTAQCASDCLQHLRKSFYDLPKFAPDSLFLPSLVLY